MPLFFRTRGRITDDDPSYVPGRRRSRTLTMLQMEAVECGAAALGIVLAYHGRILALEELRAACGVSRDGSKASNMLRAARRYGLEAKGYRRDPEQLEDLALPLIVHWNFNHFVVLEGFGKGVAHLNDPAVGPRDVSLDEFDEGFTGVALALTPGTEFVRGGQRPSLVGALRRRLVGSTNALGYVILAGLLLILPSLIVPSFTRIFVDNILVHGLHDWVRPLLLVMGLTAVVLGAITWLQQHYLLRLETKLALSASCKFFWHVLHLPAQFFAQRYAGEIGSRVGLSDRIAALLSGELATTTLNLVLIGFYASLMMQYDLVLTGVGVGAALLNLAALRYVSRRRTDMNQRLRQDQGKLMGVAFSGLQTIETLKATGAESEFFARWSGHHAKVVNAQQRLARSTQLLSALPPLLLAITTALLLGIGGSRVMQGHLSMGMLIAFQALMLGFMLPVNKMVDLGSTLQEVSGDLTRLDDVLRAERAPDLELEPAVEPGPAADGEAAFGDAAAATDPGVAQPPGLAKLSGQLELRDVSFGYSPLEPPLIKGFSLAVTPGSRVAIVGASGCGKSTLAKLVCGLYEPWTGEILFDGKPRRAHARNVLANSVALVDQSIFLFEGTVRDNVALWDTTVTEASIGDALEGAAIVEDVVQRPGGYGAIVEEGGRNYSGGQRQRLEIARALAVEPSILVLDEATSALDTHTEQAIDDAIRRRGATCLIIAHRLSTIRDCDQIIVLERGEIAQRGTHEQLRELPGPYSRLIATE